MINWKGGQHPGEKDGRTDEKYSPHADKTDLKAVPVGLARTRDPWPRLGNIVC